MIWKYYPSQYFMNKKYIGINFDRSHLGNIYEVQIFSSFHNYLETSDLIVLAINAVILLIILAYFIYRKIQQPKQRTVKVELPQKSNQIPFFTAVKNHKKGSRNKNVNQMSLGREGNPHREFRDQNNIEFKCQKCKYVGQIAERNLLNHY